VTGWEFVVVMGRLGFEREEEREAHLPHALKAVSARLATSRVVVGKTTWSFGFSWKSGGGGQLVTRKMKN